MMESNPDVEPIGGVGRLQFEFRATRGLADPVVRIERDGEGPLRYRTRAGVQFELVPDEFTRPSPDGRPVPWDPALQPAFLHRYQEAVGPGGAAARRDRAFARLVADSVGLGPSAHLSNMLTASTEGSTA